MQIWLTDLKAECNSRKGRSTSCIYIISYVMWTYINIAARLIMASESVAFEKEVMQADRIGGAEVCAENMWLTEGTKCTVHLFSNDDGTGAHREAIDFPVAKRHCNEIKEHSTKR